MAGRLTPLEFARRYYELDVYLYPQEILGANAAAGYAPPTGWQRVRADNYRLGASSWRETFWQHDIAPHFRGQPVEVRVRSISGAIETLRLNEREARRHFNPPFVGKGSPEQVQVAIQLLYRFRKVTTPLTDFVQRDFVGLDCNGFVGGYFQKIVKGLDWKTADVNQDPGPTTLMDDLLALGREVKDPKEFCIDGTYVLVWCDANGHIMNPSKAAPNSYGHVMISEPYTLQTRAGGQRSMRVVEATGGTARKLRDVDYLIRSHKQITHGGRPLCIFTVERGSPAALMTVRMSLLPV